MGAVLKLFLTPDSVIAGTYEGTILLLDTSCDHQDLENDPHKRLIEVGKLWDMDWHDSTLATGNDDGTARVFNIETG